MVRVVTLPVFLVIADYAADIDKGAQAHRRLPALRRRMRISTARTVLTKPGHLVALCYFLAAVDALERVTALLY